MKHKYKEGETVYPKASLTLKLVIRRYMNHMYHCKIEAHPNRKELVYSENELTTIPVTDTPGNNK